MKRIWIIIAIALIGATNCSHPYEEGMTGAFPFIELMSGTSISMDAVGSQTGVIELNTNMRISTKVDYPNTATSGNGWVENVTTDEGERGVVTITFSLKENTRRQDRKANINILADGKSSGYVISVNQKGFVIQSGSSNVYNGDLILATQDEVDNCIYTDINGRLIIGKEYENSDISNLSALSCINSVSTGLVVMNCGNLNSLGEIQDLNVPYVEFRGNVTTGLIGTYNGKTSRLFINTMTNPIQACTFLGGYDGIKELEIDNTVVMSLDQIESLYAIQTLILKNDSISQLSNDILSLTTLKNLDLTDNPLQNVNILAEMKWLNSLVLTGTRLTTPQIRYLEAMMTDTGITKLNLNGGNANLSLSAIETQVYSASFRANLSNMNSFVEAGYYISLTSTLEPPSDKWKRLEINGMGAYDFTINALETGKTYYIWLYAIDNNGSYYISDMISFNTIRIDFYNFSMTPVIPDFINESTGVSFSNMYSYVVKTSNGENWSEPLNKEKATNSDSYTDVVMEGVNPMCFLMTTSAMDDFAAGAKDISDFETASWFIRAVNPAGADEDIVAATLRHDFIADVKTEINFERPVARLNVSVDLNGSIGRLDDIRNVQVSLENFYEEYVFADNGTSEYICSSPYTYTFGTAIEGVNHTRVVNVTEGRHVMPQIKDVALNATVSLTLADGTVMTSTSVIDSDTTVSANNVCTLTLNVTLNRTAGTFTIDDVIFFDDTIEF